MSIGCQAWSPSPKRLLGGLDRGAGSGQAHRVQQGRVWRHSAFHPNQRAQHSPAVLPLKPQGWWKESPSPVHSCHTTLVKASPKSTKLSQPYCLWTCSLLSQECLFSALLPSRSNLRYSSSREACLPLPKRAHCPLLHILTEL